jgi:hypothetical protein
VPGIAITHLQKIHGRVVSVKWRWNVNAKFEPVDNFFKVQVQGAYSCGAERFIELNYQSGLRPTAL